MAGDEGSRSKIPVCSTTRVKSATVLSLMIDGSGSRCCRIFGWLRPDRMVMKWTQAAAQPSSVFPDFVTPVGAMVRRGVLNRRRALLSVLLTRARRRVPARRRARLAFRSSQKYPVVGVRKVPLALKRTLFFGASRQVVEFTKKFSALRAHQEKCVTVPCRPESGRDASRLGRRRSAHPLPCCNKAGVHRKMSGSGPARWPANRNPANRVRKTDFIG
jgi:hypothetical protein